MTSTHYCQVVSCRSPFEVEVPLDGAPAAPIPTRCGRHRVLHLLDQSGQPYGSVRRCCSWCGLMIGLDTAYVGNSEDFNADPINCAKVKP